MSPQKFEHISEIEFQFGLQGSYWFSHSTMRAFKTTFCFGGQVFHGRFFVTREGSRETSWGRYLVREVAAANDPFDGKYDIKTHYNPNAGRDEYGREVPARSNGFKTAAAALSYVEKLIKADIDAEAKKLVEAARKQPELLPQVTS